MAGNVRTNQLKLYATTTSERASKGQGGNQYLDIVIRNEDSEIIALVGFYPDGSGYISVLKDMKFAIKRPYAIERPLSWDELKQISESKKDFCTDGRPHRYDENGDCTGEDCYKEKAKTR